MQLKALVCPDMLNKAFGTKSPVASSSTSSFGGLSDLSWVPSERIKLPKRGGELG